MYFSSNEIIWVGNNSNSNFSTESECQATTTDCWQCYNSITTGSVEVNNVSTEIQTCKILFLFKEVYAYIARWINYLSIFFGFFGILGNLSSIYILSRPGLGSRFCHLLIILAYVDIIYITFSLFEFFIIFFADIYSDSIKNLANLYKILFPYLLHPGHQITQTSMIILTVIFSIDRYIAVFYPYIVYTGKGFFSTLLRGPKRHHVFLYLVLVLIPSIAYCIPHFLEYSTQHVQGVVILRNTLLFDMGVSTFYYKLVYYTILDVILRMLLPISILLYTNIRIYVIVKQERFMVIRLLNFIILT